MMIYQLKHLVISIKKALKKRKQRIAIITSLILIAGGSLTTVAVSVLSNTNVLSQRKVPSSKISNTGDDAAAQKILKGKAVKVTSSSDTAKVITKADAQKQMDSAVKAQQSSDQSQEAKLQQQLDALSKTNQSLTANNSSLSSQSNSSTATASSYSKQVADLQASLSSVQSDSSQTQQKLNDVQKQLDSATSESSKADSTSSSN